MGQGSATTVRKKARGTSQPPSIGQVVLMLPEPSWALRPSIGRWIGELRPLLQRTGLELILSEGGRYYGDRPDGHLAKLVAAHPRAAWIYQTADGVNPQ